MGSFDLSSISALNAVLFMSALGGVVAYLSAWAGATARQLDEDRALLPALAVSVREGRVFGPWLTYAFAGAVSAAAVALFSPQDSAVALLVALCIPACVMDLDLMIIPEELTWALLFSGALFSPWHQGTEEAVTGAALAAAALWISMAAVEYATGRNMRAGGDIAAAAAGGAWVGTTLSGAYVLCVCLVCFVYHFALRHRSEEGWVPLGPALLVAIPLAAHAGGIIDMISLAALSIA